jgi:hypothetical protein
MKSLLPVIFVVLLASCSMPFERIARQSRPGRIELPARIEFVGPPKGKPVLSMYLPAGIYEYVGEDADTWLYLHVGASLGGRAPIPGFMNTLKAHEWPAGLALFKKYDGYCAAFLVSESDAREMAGEIGAALMPKRGSKRIFRDIYPLPAAQVATFILHGSENIDQKAPNSEGSAAP